MKYLLAGLFCALGVLAGAQVPAYEYVVATPRKEVVELPEFRVPLKSSYKTEKSEYHAPARLFVISDIEGQYDTLKQLLWNAGVMDKHFNWTFGKGHLVIAGDVFDRGAQVTETLWLIYALEEKAYKAGGYVHFILGNHELMNMNGDHRFVHPRYIELAKQSGLSYDTIYRAHTELGQWLRTKNVVEKIGDRLFMHGGVSPYINRMGQPLDTINAIARRYYGIREDAIPNPEFLIFSDYGPMWYRGYFVDPKATPKQVDTTLLLYDVNKIIIGHTPVPQVSAFYGGKVINVDAPHARGGSEGLLIERKAYYRVPIRGHRIPLKPE
jgi:hypothetical protein